MNNADITLEQIREFQTVILDKDTSPNKAFQKSVQISGYVQKASKEINDVRNTLNRVLEVLAKNGGLTAEITSALTGLSVDDPIMKSLNLDN